MRWFLCLGSLLAVLGASFAARAESSAAAFPDVPAPAARSAPPPATVSPPPPPQTAPAPAPAPPPVQDGNAMTSSAAAGGAGPTSSAPIFGGTWGNGGSSVGFGTAAPREAPADVPPGYVLEEGPAKTPLIVGGIVVGITYATGLGIAATQGFENSSGWLAAPVIGPWLALSGRRDPCADAEDKQEFDSDVGKCVAEPMIRGMLVLDGVLQASGTVLMIIGASTSESRVVKKPPPPVAAAPTPMGRNGYGLAVAGVF